MIKTSHRERQAVTIHNTDSSHSEAHRTYFGGLDERNRFLDKAAVCSVTRRDESVSVVSRSFEESF